MTIHQADITSLKPFDKNAKLHDKTQVERIAQSIKEFGFVNPILADASGVVIAGHGRLLAAKKLRLEVVPVIYVTHLSDTQRRALTIADNRLGELGGGWDYPTLSAELTALSNLDLELDLDLDTFLDFGKNDDEEETNSGEEEPAKTKTECPNCKHKF